ncbi:MAG: glycosyltransferase [Candidatus Scalindua sp.]|nr:glycosyltransferase [Candidatus Scalindua sp.]MBT7591402.1 glycosyltransferase [Candidatus Scalindua sp.]
MIASDKFAKFDVSIVVPALDMEDYMPELLNSVESQTLLPREIVIVDSSETNRTAEIVAKWVGIVPISYHNVDLALPGRARNIGVKESKGEWIAFLDCKTIPVPDWLEKCAITAQKNEVFFVCGLTLFEADTSFKQILRAASIGCVAHRTLVGSLVLKESFLETGGFVLNVRSGEDMEWLERVNSLGYKMKSPEEPVITYHGFPNSLWLAIKKYCLYSMSLAKIDVSIRQKRWFSVVIILLTMFFAHNWNSVVTHWNPGHWLYIPHMTKICIILLICSPLFFRGVLKLKRVDVSAYHKRFFLVVIVVLFMFLAYKWNAIFAHWDTSHWLFVPHITKMCVLFLLCSSFFFRGVLRPLAYKVEVSYLFPWRWLLVGFVGLTLDVAKICGFLFGYVLKALKR